MSNVTVTLTIGELARLRIRAARHVVHLRECVEEDPADKETEIAIKAWRGIVQKLAAAAANHGPSATLGPAARWWRGHKRRRLRASEPKRRAGKSKGEQR